MKFKKDVNGEALEHFKKINIEYVNEMILKDIPFERVEKLKRQAVYFKKNKNITGLAKVKGELIKILGTQKKRMIEKATLYNHGFYNSKFKEYFPQLDYFFDNELSFQSHCPNYNKVFTYTVEALLPVNVDSISIEQIKDFRGKTSSQRIKFRKASEDILKNIMHSSTEKDLGNSMLLFQMFLNDELDTLQTIYKDCKINAAIKGLTVFTVSSMLPFISSALSIPIYTPAGIISSISFSSASILSAIEKGRAESNKSPWGFLMSLKDLKKQS